MNFKRFDFGKPRHQVFVTPEDQDRAREHAHAKHPIRSKTPCANCGRLIAARLKAAHKKECKGNA